MREREKERRDTELSSIVVWEKRQRRPDRERGREDHEWF
jgi:hypothetical protein